MDGDDKRKEEVSRDAIIDMNAVVFSLKMSANAGVSNMLGAEVVDEVLRAMAEKRNLSRAVDLFNSFHGREFVDFLAVIGNLVVLAELYARRILEAQMPGDMAVIKADQFMDLFLLAARAVAVGSNKASVELRGMLEEEKSSGMYV